MSKRLVICSKQRTYITYLAEHISQRKDLLLQINICFSLEKLRQLEKNCPMDIVLLDEKIPYEERKHIKGKIRFVLTAQHCKDLGREERELYQYQSAQKIIEQITEGCEKIEGLFRSFYGGAEGIKEIIGIYSPVHRIGKSEFAVTLGKELGKQRRVLYIGLEEYSGFDDVEEKAENTLTEVLYYLKQEGQTLGTHMNSAIVKDETLDMLVPIPVVKDLKEVMMADWEALFFRILRESSYELVIVDFSESVNGVIDLLRICDTLYMPIIENRIAMKKMARYRETMEKLGYKDIVEKAVEITMRRDKTICVKEILESRNNDTNRSTVQ